MSRLTIIIPFFGDCKTAAFEETLASVLLHRTSDTEILIADGVDYSDPWNIASEGVVFVHAKSFGHPIDLLNEAIGRSRGDIIHILSPGTEVSEGWIGNMLACFESPNAGIAIPCICDRRKPKRIFALGIRYGRGGTLRTVRRSQWPDVSGQTLVPHVSAVFFRKSALEQIGLLNRSFLPQLAYADAALAVTERGWETVVEPSCRITVRPNHLPASLPFAWGVQIERLYFRWLGRSGVPLSLGEHFASFFIDFWRHFPRIRAFQSLFGRLCGLVFCCGAPISICRRHNGGAGTGTRQNGASAKSISADSLPFERCGGEREPDQVRKTA